MRSILVIFGVSMALMGGFQSANGARSEGDKPSESQQQQKILHYINEYRVNHHLKPLKMSKVVSKEAKKHSQDMAKKRLKFGHDKFNNRIKRLYQELSDCNGGAENVAYYRLDAQKLVQAWVASSGHRKNILGNYNVTGIGIASNKKGWAYFTQIFIRTS